MLGFNLGLLQGSILRQFLFNLYIIYIVNIQDNSFYVIYADDASIFSAVKIVTNRLEGLMKC